jgi:hypothetical protein
MKKYCVGWGLFLERIPIWLMILSTVVAIRDPKSALVLFLIFFNLA